MVTPFTGFSYRDGLAALGQGLGRVNESMENTETRNMLLSALGDDPKAAALAAAGQPGLAIQYLQQQRDEKRAAAADRLLGGLSAVGGAPAASSPATAGGAGGPYAGAVSGIESGGRYDALGPVTKTGDRAYGKYQIMGGNIPSWTQEVLGRSLTPQEFLNSQEAQDAVFNAKFGQYAAKYGPEGAARAWFAGEGGMNDLGRRDQLGTSVGDYGKRFMAGLGGQPAQAPAASAPVQAGNPAAAADAQRVAREGGPRMVLSAENPAVQPGAQPGSARPQPAPMGDAAADMPAPGATPVQGGFLVPSGDGRPATPAAVETPEMRRLKAQAELYRRAAAVGPRGQQAIYSQTAAQLEQEYRQRQAQQEQIARDQAKEAAQIERQRVRPVADPDERARLGFKPEDGPVFMDGNGRPILPTKAGTQVNIDQKGEGKFAEAAGQGIAKRFLALSEEGDSGQLDLATIGQLRALGGRIDNSTFPALRGWLSDRGVKIGDDVSHIEAFNSLIDKLTPAQRIPGAGATSDFDAKMFKSSLPSLMQTPEGRNLVMGTLEGLAQAKIERAKIAEQALSGELKPSEAVKALRALPSPNLAFRSGLEDLKKAGRIGGSQSALPPPAPQAAAPQVGTIDGGYRFRGGNPADPNSWERVQ